MPTLFLIRHGENDWLKKGILVGNTLGIPLNARGIEQACAIREALRSLPLRAIYSSPLQRAVETAAPSEPTCVHGSLMLRIRSQTASLRRALSQRAVIWVGSVLTWLEIRRMRLR